MAQRSTKPTSGLRSLLRDERFWQIAFQVIVTIAVILTFSYLFGNLSQNLRRQGTEFSFGFLQNPAGFGIGENMLGYETQDSYAKVIQAGIVNSLRLIFVSIITATIVGVAAGVASFSDNWLLHKISRTYVGLVRNVPLLLQLVFWYSAVFLAIPTEANQIVFPNPSLPLIVANNRNVSLPGPGLPGEVWIALMLLGLAFLLFGLLWNSINKFRYGRFAAGIAGWLERLGAAAVIVAVVVVDYFLLMSNSSEDMLFFKGAIIALFTNPEGLWVIALAVAIVAIFVIWRIRLKSMVEDGSDGKLLMGVMIAIGIAALAILVFAFNWNAPQLSEAGRASGGLTMSVNYVASVTGLTFYTGAFIAEIVRAGIQSVPRGQWEAARSVGLTNDKAMRLVVFPQSLRVLLPPLNSEFANLAKNSSLAFAVGYPELYNLANTTFNQTGKPIEVFLMMMATYLTLNLLISLNMNQLNKAVQFKER
ncbi:ABC transporter, permease protein, putative [Synechococcus sp. PCC 7335]|uniref:amino acid ABC transporter permease n=1 Tax=Synechococcus sp. (strain ATCC 29403 / PCC 7335) TaxID=91464 RepID=UPI00017EC061|nr:ABC transporter permease subunit [Synechococcus sp. PCC 7335]EDX85045.1 ABC transporter, permease protein, putative [Synechococcus sp. PCC 7335]